jgi:uncharacterized protein (TIGR03435 family)
MIRVLLVCGLVSGAFIADAAQVLSFDVASVRANTSGAPEGSLGPRAGGYGAINVPLRILIVRAYQLRPFQVVGGPAWIDSERFDLDARASANSSPDDVLAMLQALLAERFRLVVRRETREQPIYVLVTARDDARPGPQLKRSGPECPGNPVCKMSGGYFPGKGGSLQGIGQPLTQLATTLGSAVDRIVLDRTGLTGAYDFSVTWKSGGFAVSPAGASDDGPSLFTALQEQLGLKLEPSRGPVDVLVVDSAERPTPD